MPCAAGVPGRGLRPWGWGRQQEVPIHLPHSWEAVNGVVGGKGEKVGQEHVCSVPSYKLLENPDL